MSENLILNDFPFTNAIETEACLFLEIFNDVYFRFSFLARLVMPVAICKQFRCSQNTEIEESEMFRSQLCRL